MKAIYGLYATPEEAQHAVDNLRSAGYTLGDITILSSEPLEEFEFGRKDNKTWMPKVAVLGGAVGCLSAFLLTYITQQSWAINTGGMPITTNFTNLIIIFEVTMMGAIFSTVGTLLVTARIPGRVGKIYDPEVSSGKILIGVANPRNEAAVETALGGTTKRIG
jgi:hypothetical protein